MSAKLMCILIINFHYVLLLCCVVGCLLNNKKKLKQRIRLQNEWANKRCLTIVVMCLWVACFNVYICIDESVVCDFPKHEFHVCDDHIELIKKTDLILVSGVSTMHCHREHFYFFFFSCVYVWKWNLKFKIYTS